MEKRQKKEKGSNKPGDRWQEFCGLPAFSLRQPLADTLAAGSLAVLQAPPGSGKTTLLPLLLQEEPWLAGQRILMLEPRRLAARNAARRMAGLRGEKVGETIGYRMRGESRCGPKTRIEVVTEGILTRIIQADPGLEGYGLVIFDEFHERHLQGDLGLALTLETRELLRPDLRLLVMSATLDEKGLGSVLERVPRLRAEGRLFPVTTHYLENTLPAPAFRLEPVYRAVLRALDETRGDLLVFLPGAGEILNLEKRLARRLAELGAQTGIELLPLYGALPQNRQELIFRPHPGRRRVILATDIAESSLTIPGVRVVIDSGWRRAPRFDAAAGMGRLETVRISRAAADQRRGRAGREAEGVCYRLWSRESEDGMAAATPPEILNADLAPLALELALWGATAAEELPFPTPPPAAALERAFSLLELLGAVDRKRRITVTGREMAQLGLHPRLARMVIAGEKLGCGRLAADLAALLLEPGRREREPAPDSDLETRLRQLYLTRRATGRNTGEAEWQFRCRREARRIRERLAGDDKRQPEPAREGNGERPAKREKRIPRSPQENPPGESPPEHLCGRLLALAYPDRIAKKREAGSRRYLLSSGREASFAAPEPLGACDFLVIAELDGRRERAQIRRAAAYSESALREQFASQLLPEEVIAWDDRALQVRAVTRLRFGALLLSQERLAAPDPAKVAAAWLAGLRRHGFALLDFNDECRQFCARIEFVRRLLPPGERRQWPEAAPGSLAAKWGDWLAADLGRIRSRDELKKLKLLPRLQKMLDWNRRKTLDELAPPEIELPSGRRARIDYTAGEQPVLAARLQELLGWDRHPTVAGGRIRLRLEILSPARRPLQVTEDLPGFWRGSYAGVRREMRGRYPKHAWPEKPWEKD